jgi:SAM-dependent methyltransferase
MSEPPAAPGLLRRVAGRVRRTAKQGVSLAFNNVVMNNAAIMLGFESQMKGWQHPYRTFRPSTGKKLQENAGFSDRPEINEAVDQTHRDIARVASDLVPNRDRPRRALDIGCGPGLYLKDFAPEQWNVTGLDLNSGMCELARQTCPFAQIIEGNFLNLQLPNTFDLIYSVGVFIYIGRTEIDGFFKKVHDSLEPGGVLFLNYQHAISYWDLLYPDLAYIQYSPRLVQKVAGRHLEIVEHHHAFDDRQIDLYDKTPYKSLNAATAKTFRNSSILVARRAQ